MSDSIRFGLVTPVVQRNPRFGPADWEQTSGVTELRAIAQSADELGYDVMCFPEHVAIPTDVAEVRGARYYAPMPTMGFVAAATSRIQLATYCAVLAYHHPLELVKQFGTLDELSEGRVIAGVGVGSLEREFELLGADFHGRGARADEAIEVIRSCFGNPSPSHSGTYFQIDGVRVDPCGRDRHLEIWVGGRTKASLRRALDHGDGWSPFKLLPDEIRSILDDLGRPLETTQGRPLELVLQPEPPLDPLGNPDGARRTITSYVELGATVLLWRFRHDSLAHYIEQLGQLEVLRRDLVETNP